MPKTGKKMGRRANNLKWKKDLESVFLDIKAA